MFDFLSRLEVFINQSYLQNAQRVRKVIDIKKLYKAEMSMPLFDIDGSGCIRYSFPLSAILISMSLT